MHCNEQYIGSQAISDALEVMRGELGLDFHDLEYDTGEGPDLVARTGIAPNEQQFDFDYKPRISSVNLAQLITRKADNPHFTLVTDYINPVLAQRLKEADVQFIDTCGNAYIRRPNLFIFVKGHKPSENKPVSAEVLGKAFNKKGLQVTYMLLKQPDTLSLSYREIADLAGVSLGMVGPILKHLDLEGYIDLKQRKFLNKEKLLLEWAQKYALQIRKERTSERFTTQDTHWHQHFAWEHHNILLGGDLAADSYTNFLSSNHARVYANKHEQVTLLREARLRKVKEFESPEVIIELFEPYISIKAMKGSRAGVVDPLIVYAELLASDNVRHAEVAEKIYDQHLRFDK